MTDTMRLRLRFSAAYDLGEHQQIMLPVPPHLRTVRDFACHVSRRLKLTTSGAGTEPPLFFLDEFVLSQTDELRTVVRDDETLDVKLPCAQMVGGAGCVVSECWTCSLRLRGSAHWIQCCWPSLSAVGPRRAYKIRTTWGKQGRTHAQKLSADHPTQCFCPQLEHTIQCHFVVRTAFLCALLYLRPLLRDRRHPHRKENMLHGI